MDRARWREQDGIIRGALWLFIIVAIIAVSVLDGVSVFSAQQKIRNDARDAADAAKHMYVQTTGNIADAEQAAKQLLTSSGDRPMIVKVDTSSGDAVFTVTANRPASTYFLKFGTHLPKVGKRIAKMLLPQATEQSE